MRQLVTADARFLASFLTQPWSFKIMLPLIAAFATRGRRQTTLAYIRPVWLIADYAFIKSIYQRKRKPGVITIFP